MTGTIAQAIAAASAQLAEAGIDNAARDARALVAAASGLKRDRLTLAAGDEMAEEAQARLDSFVAQRLDRQPVSQIIGQRLFWGRSFRITPDVLDPRPETETLVACALARPAPRNVLDLGTGSGILAVTLAAERRDAQVLAVDLSPAALTVAGANAIANGVDDRVRFQRSDWFETVAGRFDLILCNPPYIPQAEMETLARDVREWEPYVALSPGGDGLDAYRRIARGLAAHLAPDGAAFFEFGAGQEQAVAEIFLRSGEFAVVFHDDLDGRPRIAEVTYSA